jgi:hypothetical protein
VLYRLSGTCMADAPACPESGFCSCADDISDQNRKSTLELTGLEAGTYYIVVDSFPTVETSGTDYELTVTVE